jgi:hypothetical protein
MSYVPLNPNGQASKANSAPVVLASDQNNSLETGGNLDAIAAATANLYNLFDTNSATTQIKDPNTNASVNVMTVGSTNAMNVALVDGSGNQVTSFGGGVQYTIGDVPDGSATGTLSMQLDSASGVAIPLISVDGATNINISGVGSNGGIGQKSSNDSIPVVIASDQTVPVSGTITANIGTSDGIATSANQTNGNQKAQIVDGSGNVIGSTSNALNVAIKSGGGSGTQYANASVVATPTGTVALGYDGTNVRALTTDTSGNLKTTITNSSIAVSGSVTANAGTNLNTSALALESGGNLASIQTNTYNTATNTTGLASTVGPISPGTASTKTIAIGGVYNSSAPTPSSGQQLALQLDSSGNLKTTITNSSIPVTGTFYQTTQPVSQSGTWSVGLSNGTNSIGSISNTSFAVTQGTASSLNATVVPGNPTGQSLPSVAMPAGFQARTIEQTATSSGNQIIGVADKVGKIINLPYANPENFAYAVGSSSTTGSISLSPNSFTTTSGLKNYITGFSISNTGTVTSLITILSGSTVLWYTIAPAGGGSNFTFPTPIATAAATQPTVSITTASTTIYVSLTGYIGA